MGNEVSQEGGVEGGAPATRAAPPLLTQQSMPLPTSQAPPAPESPGARRGSADPQLAAGPPMRRASSAGAAPVARRASIVEVPPVSEVDLSNLSEEERATILSVMARAQSMEEEPPAPPGATREEDAGPKREPERDTERCSLCRATPKEGSCVECGALCCRNCSRAIPSGKIQVCMCVRCVERYPQLQSRIHKPEDGDSQAEETPPPDRRRRASEVAPLVDSRTQQQQQPPPARGRSDSLPSTQQRPRIKPQQQLQRPQQQQQARPRNGIQQHQQRLPGPPPNDHQQQQLQRFPPPDQQLQRLPPDQQKQPHQIDNRQRFQQDNSKNQDQGQDPRTLQQQQTTGARNNHQGTNNQRKITDNNSPDHRASQVEEQRPDPLWQQTVDPQQRHIPHPPADHPRPHQQQTGPRHPASDAFGPPHHASEQQRNQQNDPRRHHQLEQKPPHASNGPRSDHQGSHNHQQYKDGDPFQMDASQPRPQHPVGQAPEGSRPPQDIGLLQRNQQEHPVAPPPRNQRVRQPPEQQATPKPQHPQDVLLHYPHDIFKNNQSHPPADKDVFQTQQPDTSDPSHQRPSNGHPFGPEVARNGHPQYPPFDQDVQKPLVNGCSQEDKRNGGRRQEAVEGTYVSLSEPGLGFQPPATLPRTKPPPQQQQQQSEVVPQPASRANRAKQQQQQPPGTQTLPGRGGTNPFRTETNPFRRESLPAFDAALDPAGEYVTVARRGSLDDKVRPMTAHDQNRLNEMVIKASEGSPRHKDRRIDQQQQQESPERSRGRGEGGEEAHHRHHLDEEQRRNAINSGNAGNIQEPSARRQLPAVSADGRQQQRRQPVPYGEQGIAPPPVPKARTSLPTSQEVSSFAGECRNGGIPRTVPLTSLTLQQREDEQQAINDLSQQGLLRQDPHHHQRQRDDLVQPNIVEHPNHVTGFEKQQKANLPFQKPDQNIVENSNHVTAAGFRSDDRQKASSSSAQPLFARQDIQNIVEPNHVGFRADERQKQSLSRQELQKQAFDQNVILEPNHGFRMEEKPKTQSLARQDLQEPRPEDRQQKQPPPTQPRKRTPDPWREDPRKGGTTTSSKPAHPGDAAQDAEGYQDAEEEEDIDDYFQMIENAIGDRKPQVIVGARRTSDIQRQLFGRETDVGGRQTLNAFGQKEALRNNLNAATADKAEDVSSSQYIIQPASERLLLHELTPDARQAPPSANHYLEEHKTQPVSYEAFSSAKQQQQLHTTDSKSQPHYYYQHLQQQQAEDVSAQKAKVVVTTTKSEPTPPPQQDWSPVSDLSPILDVSPSVEAAEQELMEKFQEKVEDRGAEPTEEEEEELRLQQQGVGRGMTRARSGTISGMLEEFTRALGLPGTSPVDDANARSPTSLAISPVAAPVTSSVSNLHKEYQDVFGSPQKSSSSGADSPQKQQPQPTTPRRSHRRLPQPTVEQMQAAVAMAAQGPRQANPVSTATTTVGAALFGVTSTSDQPPSPTLPWSKDASFEHAYKQQTTNQEVAPPSPAPRVQARNAQKSNDVVPTTTAATPQEAPSAPVRRLRSSSYGGGTPSPGKPYCEDVVARLNGGGSSSPFGDATTAGSPQTPSTPRDKIGGGGDSSDTQSEAESIKSVRLRRKLPNLPQEQQQQQGSRKTTEEGGGGGLTPAQSAVVTTTVATSLETSRLHEHSPLTALGAPQPGSLSPLPGRRSTEGTRTPSPGGEAGTKLPQYMQSLKQQLREELKAVTEERKVLLEQRGRGDGTRTPAGPPPPPTMDVTSEDGSPYQQTKATQQATQQMTLQQQQQQLPKTPTTSAAAQTQVKALRQTISQQLHFHQQPQQQLQQTMPAQTQILSPYRTTAYLQGGQMPVAQQEQIQMYQSLRDAPVSPREQQPLYGGRRPLRSPLPDAVRPVYRPQQDDDITIMTTATTTVVSASEQWPTGDGGRGRHRQQPPTTTVAPSAVPTSVESLRRLQSRAQQQTTSPKKGGRRRHTSEISVPASFPSMQPEQHHTLHHPPRQMQQPQYIQYYAQLQQQQQAPQAVYRSMEFKSADAHVRSASDLLRASARYGGSVGSGLGQETTVLHQGGMRRGPNNNSYYTLDNRIAEQQQRLTGPDAYFQTLNNEINRLRRSSESLHREALIYDKPVWGGGPQMTPQQDTTTRTSPQTTERRKRKEKKSRKPRSWHPSPYVSEDEDDQLTREEKKARVREEIARRRQQMQEQLRLHDELCKLASERGEQQMQQQQQSGRTTPYGNPSIVDGMVYQVVPDQHQQQQQARTAPDGDDTSSVLKAIDEILRKDLYSGPLSRSAWATYHPGQQQQQQQQQQYLTMPAGGRGRTYDYTPTADVRAWYEEEQLQQQQQQYYHMQQQEHSVPQESSADPESAMDESIMRIASTFPTDEPPDILLSSTPSGGHLSPRGVTPAMPLLPDMPTRSRKLLENLGSSPLLQQQQQQQPSRSGSAQSLYQDHRSGDEECTDDGSLGHRMQGSASLHRHTTQQQRSSRAARAPVSKISQKYEFPVKRILLTRDPKDRSVSGEHGNGLGMKVVGGKEVPGSNGVIGAYVAKIFPGGVVETLGEVKEGDQVLEWNGIPLTGRTYEEVQRIIASSADEVEIVIRCDLNMLETLNRQRRMGSPGMGSTGGGGTKGEGPGRGGPSPARSPYSPSPSRGHGSPALGSGGRRGGGGGGHVVGVTTHGPTPVSNYSHTSSYENLLQTHNAGQGHRFVGRVGLSTAPHPTSRSVFAAPSDWPDIYETALYSSPQSPDEFLEDHFQSNWQSGSNIEEMQFQVCCGPGTAIVYVPIAPVRPMVKSTPSTLLGRDSALLGRSDPLEDDYEPLLTKSGDRALGFYDLLRPRHSLGKVSTYFNGIREKAEQYDLRKKGGSCRSVTEDEPRERPRAPSDLPGIRPVFVNDWKAHKKSKNGENDDNNNQTEKGRKPCVGSSPDATPYNILPKGCRGSFCIIL